MTNYATGSGESALMGFETIPGVLPGSAAADKLPVTSLQLAPNVQSYEDKAMTGNGAAREVVYGKPGADGSFAITCSRESLNAPMKAFFGTITNFGVAGWYDHYLTFSAGSLQPSFFIEERFSDADTPEWILYLGNKISQWQGNVDPEGLMEATFTAMGLATQEFTSEQVTGTITDRTGSRAFDYIPTVLIEGGGAFGYGSNLKWTADRKLARKSAIDSQRRALFVAPTATRKITVNLTAYFPNNALLTKALNSTETSLSCLVPAPESGHGLKVIWPCGKYKPFGPKSQGQDVVMQDIESDFYSRGVAANVPGEALSKFFTSVVITGGTNDSFKVKVDGGAPVVITLIAGTRTFAQILSQVNAALTGGSAVGEFLTYDSAGAVTGGRMRMVSSATTGSASSIQVDSSGTAQATLGYDTVVHVGFDAVDMMVRLSNADATI